MPLFDQPTGDRADRDWFKRLVRTQATAAVLILIGASCAGTGSGGGSSSSSSRSFSGTVTLPEACSSSNAYRVDCLVMSSTVSTLSGALLCPSGGSQGTFVISDLPATPVACGLKKLVSGVTTDYGTLMLPSSGIDGMAYASTFDAGTTSVAVTLTGTGDIYLSTVEDHRLASGIATGTSIQSANYDFSCLSQSEADSTSTVYLQNHCKCTLGDITAAGYTKYSDCITDSAARFTISTDKKYNLQVYKATARSAISDDASRVIVKQADITHIVSLWETASGTTYRGSSGGEGLSDLSAALTFETSTPTTALTWLLGTVTVNGYRATFNTNTSNTLPAVTATVGDWTTWLSQAVAGSNWGACSWHTEAGPISSTSASTITACLAEFSQKILGTRLSTQVMPRILLERRCTSSGCDITLANARVKVSGFDFKYDTSWSATSQASVTKKSGSIAVSPSLRLAAEQWHSYADLSGGLQNRRTYSHWYSCKTSGGDVTSSSCTGSSDGISCSIVEEFYLHALPTSTIGTLNAVMHSQFSLVRAKFVSSNTALDGTDATTQCTDAMSTLLPLKSATFLVKATASN